MTINIVTLFPEYFDSNFNASILKRALAADLLHINIVHIRDFATDKHRTTDDRPYGGGPGMVMKVEPIQKALESLKVTGTSKTLLTSAKGSLFTQQRAEEFSKLDTVTIICGHYEGVDERVAQNLIDEEIRIGDYVLTGGEPAASVIIDAVTRLLPGVLGNDASNKDESHSTPGTLGYPQYTRPETYNGWSVPSVLLDGNHADIKAWREQNRQK
jgi:tRNA (guanine37-N1)-methyltransferase